MSNVIILDNCISELAQANIAHILTTPGFNWIYTDSSNGTPIVYQDKILNNNYIFDAPKFASKIIENNNIFENVNYLPALIPVLSAIPYTIEFISKLGVNFKCPHPKNKSYNFGVPHVDFNNYGELDNYITAIYYVNDSDGDTIIYNETVKNIDECHNLSINQSITPKAGRIVIFNGNTFHSANTPINYDKRIVININLLIKEKIA
jgi:hypothetical protein